MVTQSGNHATSRGPWDGNVFDPGGVEGEGVDPMSGGIASLNHRLIAATPPGSKFPVGLTQNCGHATKNKASSRHEVTRRWRQACYFCPLIRSSSFTSKFTAFDG
jgi:hypothetical protein